MDYLKIGRYDELAGREKILYRLLEILPGFLSWATLLLLFFLSFVQPIFVAYFIIAFDIYWLLLVLYLSLHLISAYRAMQQNIAINWRERLKNLQPITVKIKNIDGGKTEKIFSWSDIIHLVLIPIYKEKIEVIKPGIEAFVSCGYPLDKIILVLAVEERGGHSALAAADYIKKNYADKFRNFLLVVHPDNLKGEVKGKGANQAWAARMAKRLIIDREKIDYDKIIVSVFDADTVISPDYFHILTYKFLTSDYPHRQSYQPIPIYNNNIWEAPFFSRVASASNTFWQMMQQIREERLATYSSHAMSWRALVEIDFWSTKMVSEDSRIFWHCFLYYKGDYSVLPLHYPISMDVCMDKSFLLTAKNLYKQQRRWGWGVENVPYLIFNFLRQRHNLPTGKFIRSILIQLYGFHSWATNALIIAVIGWLPLIFGGSDFNSSVLSKNLPAISRTLMILAMFGLVLSAIISTRLLPPKPKKYSNFKYILMVGQWFVLPLTIIIFGSLPALEAQTRLMFKKYLGFWTTPKVRNGQSSEVRAQADKLAVF